MEAMVGRTMAMDAPTMAVAMPPCQPARGRDMLEFRTSSPNRSTYVAKAKDYQPETQERARLTVAVPEAAIVYVNGNRTKSTGPQRVFVSSLLNDDQAARFEVRAVVEHDGQATEATRIVTVRSGQARQLAFDLAAPQTVQTALIINVPEDAEVDIAGRRVKQRGKRRVLTTKRLTSGKEFSDVAIRATLNLQGQQVTKVQSITLVGGKQHELTFDFTDAALASR